MIYPDYDSHLNYLELCIEYETNLPSNKIREWSHWFQVLKVIEESWSRNNGECDLNFLWYQWNNGNLFSASKKKTFKELQTIFNKLNISSTNRENMWMFVTINFNPQTITPSKQLKISKKIQEMKYWNYCDFVCEKHRENGIHHHTHFLIKTDDTSIYYTSKIVDKIFQILSGKKNGDLILNKAFIDVLGPCNKKKDFQEFKVYYNYVRGIKRSEKQKYINMDDTWRDENKIEKLYTLEKTT